jgi:23S rRNA pseudouridine2605 synthase
VRREESGAKTFRRRESRVSTPAPRKPRSTLGPRNRKSHSPTPHPQPPILAGQPSQRLQKILAQSGLGSRRDIESLIEQGRITVNGRPAQLGNQVGPRDRVRVNGRLVQLKFERRLPRVILYHKPEGEIVSRDDPQARASVFDRLPRIRGGRWVSVGRLDYNTCGLLIFTTSGELAHRLMHPRFEVEREYAVRIRGRLAEEHLQRLTAGIALPEGAAKVESIEEQGGEAANHWYRIVVSEGRNRLVRRMFEELGFTVSRLMRTRFGIVSLPPQIKRGMWKELPAEEVRKLLEWAKIDSDFAPGRRSFNPVTASRSGKPRRDTAFARRTNNFRRGGNHG